MYTVKILPIIYGVILIVSITILIHASSSDNVFAHQSGCHRWHSCPSDSGSYTCGDLGYCSQCPDNKYCKAGKPWSSSSSSYSRLKANSQATRCKGSAECLVSKVTKIIDGDTLQISKYKIRLSLTNTPEKNQKGYSEAVAFTKKLCPVGSTITVDQDDGQKFDEYKRLLGKVYCGGKLLNAALLDSKLGTISKEFCGISEFGREDWAKRNGC